LCLDICKRPSLTRQSVTDIQSRGEHLHLGNGVLSGQQGVNVHTW